MNLTYSEVKKLKGQYLIHMDYPTQLLHVKSVGKFINIEAKNNGICYGHAVGSIPLNTFLDKTQKEYDFADEKFIEETMNDRFEELLSEHAMEIMALAHERYYKMGGNGVADAIDEVEKRYGYKIDYDYVSKETELRKEYL